MLGINVKKALFVVFLLTGYQTSIFCLSVLEYALGASASLTGLAMLYYNKRYRSHKNRFAQQELLNDAFDQVGDIGSNYYGLITAYQKETTVQAKSAAVGRLLDEEILRSKNYSAAYWLENVPCRFRNYRTKVHEMIEETKNHKKVLLEKKDAWDSAQDKDLLFSQLDMVIQKVDAVIPPLTFIAQELPYRLFLQYKASGVEKLLKEEIDLASQAKDDSTHAQREFKVRLEQRIKSVIAANRRFPYTAYSTDCGSIRSHLAEVSHFLKDWKPLAHQQPEEIRKLAADIEKASQHLKILIDAIYQTSDYKNEVAVIEAERRAREAERRAEEARREAERRIREAEMLRILEQQRAEQRARDAERRAREAEQRARDAQFAQMQREANQRAQENAQRDAARRAQENAQREADRRSQEIAQRARDEERRSREIQEQQKREERRLAEIHHAAQQTPVYNPHVYHNAPQPSAPPMQEVVYVPSPSAPPLE